VCRDPGFAWPLPFQPANEELFAGTPELVTGREFSMDGAKGAIVKV